MYFKLIEVVIVLIISSSVLIPIAGRRKLVSTMSFGLFLDVLSLLLKASSSSSFRVTCATFCCFYYNFWTFMQVKAFSYCLGDNNIMLFSTLALNANSNATVRLLYTVGTNKIFLIVPFCLLLWANLTNI